jgi:hypothetical protein
MVLLANIDRCTGWWIADTPGHAAVHRVCTNCARRVGPPEERRSYVLPKAPVDGVCVFKIVEGTTK